MRDRGCGGGRIPFEGQYASDCDRKSANFELIQREEAFKTSNVKV